MPEFGELRNNLQQARRQIETQRVAAQQASQRVKKLQAELTRLERILDPTSIEQTTAQRRLKRRVSDAKRQAKSLHQLLDRARQTELEHRDAFAEINDPREGVRFASTTYPFLLLPVRLETRFKTLTDVAGAVQNELWVRVYPDDCAIDSFEEALSESEVINARHYWIERWRAGNIEDQLRGAWRGLVAAHGSGRAAWIIQSYVPTNPGAEPTKTNANDIILVIPAEVALQTVEFNLVATYWRAVWLADGNNEKSETAQQALIAALGEARANELIATYLPANLNEQPAIGLKKSDVAIHVALLLLPKAASLTTKTQSWTQAAKTQILPDRFVLIAYASGVKEIEVLGEPIPIPLIVSPDPSAPLDQQLRQKDGELIVGEEMRWMVDFEQAIKVGMGFQIPLTSLQAARGFDRLFVLGLRLSADEQESQKLLETLLTHHRYSRSGLSLIPQGTPTNNTEKNGTGFSRSDDADASYADNFKAADRFNMTDDWFAKRDGQWLAEALGIDPTLLQGVRNSAGVDQGEAHAMNVALWPATLGYMMDTMMQPLCTDEDVAATRWFFTHFVSGRGMLPAIRIGAQPYGILPATRFSHMTWAQRGNFPVIGGLPEIDRHRQSLLHMVGVLDRMDNDWAAMAQNVAHVGTPGDPQQTLLDILGLHPASVEFHQRYAKGLRYLYNLLNFDSFGDNFFNAILSAKLFDPGLDLLHKLGYTGSERPEILEKFFHTAQHLLKGPLIDDRPLSETAPIRSYTDDNRNYIQWLIDAASRSLEVLRTQPEFKDDQPPSALLYIMLRHALMLSFWETSVRLHQEVGLIDKQILRTVRHESEFIQVREKVESIEGRWGFLYKPEIKITGNPDELIGEFIPRLLGATSATADLTEQLKALEQLQGTPTARLERLFAEHIDCCAYRLDAWRLGLVNYALAATRLRPDGDQVKRVQGLYLGAYGWLEDVRPENKRLTPVNLEGELKDIFNRPSDPPLERDTTNGGYIHAPSLNHAVTAAVLRNGYLSNATPANPQSLAINLSSERVRLALSILEGIRGGQSLGALLGYRLERGLHDRHAVVELDQFIFKLRKAFPLRADRLTATKSEPDVSIEAIEARNVIDGLSLVNQVKRTGTQNYPFGKKVPEELPDATPEQRTAINKEVELILDIHDAVADLALAEGVHQAVQGNYDRAAATLETYSKGNFPPEPDVVQTPRSGIGLTHRVGLHLSVGLDTATSPLPGITVTPRASAEPALNAWLSTHLPLPANVGCQVKFSAPVNGMTEMVVTQQALQLQPIDLLYLLQPDRDAAMSELDDRILRHVIESQSPRPDIALTLHYTERLPSKISFFELIPLISSLRTLVLRSRPLRASDIALQNEATQRQEQAVFLDRGRVTPAQSSLTTLQSALTTFYTTLASEREQGVVDIDSAITSFVALFAQAGNFGIPQTGWGFVYAWKRERFSELLSQVADRIARWNDKLATFDNLIAEYDLLPADTSEEQRIELLQRAELQIATQLTTALATSSAYRNVLTGSRSNFATRLSQFVALTTLNTPALESLMIAIKALLPISAFDAQTFTLDAVEKQILTFTGDLVNLTKSLAAEIDKRRKAVQTHLDAHDSTITASRRVQALQDAAKTIFGDEFQLIPEFILSPEQGNEWEKAITDSTNGGLFNHLVAQHDFPIDDWLYGIARVREKMHHWEQVLMLTNAFATSELTLLPIQLPYKANDAWLAMEFPTTYNFDSERLLYTAHYTAPFQKSGHQCGLLLDEWTEVIPARQETTGITFHYDRPNSESPQTMLLVTPVNFDGVWQWQDIVDTLSETLDMARKRGVEPEQVDQTPYAWLLPATVMAVTLYQISISANLALNNNVYAFLKRE